MAARRQRRLVQLSHEGRTGGPARGLLHVLGRRRRQPACSMILVDGEKIALKCWTQNKPGEFFAVEYPIPEELTRGKQQVTVRLQADQGATAGGIFDLRLLRAEP